MTESASPTNAIARGADARSFYPWLVVGILALGYLVATVDRFLLGVALPAVKTDLQLTDTELGLLAGPAFALSFCIFSLPLGRLADLFHRCWMIAAAIALWSLATAALAFMDSFSSMFVAIVIIGIGEAAFVPAASSLTAAYFRSDQVGRAMSVMMAGGSFGKVVAFVVGGGLLALMAGQTIVLLGQELAPWRVLFILAAVPGILLAIVFVFLKDPRGKLMVRPPVREALRHLNSRKLIYALHIGYSSCAALVPIVLATWSSSFYVRNFDLDLPTAALMSGIATAVAGPIGFFIGGYALDVATRRRVRGAPPLVLACALILTIPCALAFSASDGLYVSLVGYGLAQTAVQMGGAASIVGMLLLTPPQHRGVAMSIYSIAVALCSVGLGPALIGIVNDGVFAGANLGAALQMVLVGAAILGIALAAAAWRNFPPPSEE